MRRCPLGYDSWWHGEYDPYRILVSEVMLLQTRVQTVLAYYDGWLERFPDGDAFDDAEIDDVLKAWKGLGYYRRARNLPQAACFVHERPDRARCAGDVWPRHARMEIGLEGGPLATASERLVCRGSVVEADRWLG